MDWAFRGGNLDSRLRIPPVHLVVSLALNAAVVLKGDIIAFGQGRMVMIRRCSVPVPRV